MHLEVFLFCHGPETERQDTQGVVGLIKYYFVPAKGYRNYASGPYIVKVRQFSETAAIPKAFSTDSLHT